MRNKKRNKMFLLVILVLGLTIGFATLATTLKINGNATIYKNSWRVYWDSVGNVQKSSTVTETVPAEVDENDETKVNFTIELNEPGDFYEFQVDAVNAGSLDAMVDDVSLVINDDENAVLPPYIKFTIKYADDQTVENGQMLAKADLSTNPITPTRDRYKVRIEYLRSITNEQLSGMSNSTSYAFSVSVPYEQADEDAYNRHRTVLQPGTYFTMVPDASTYSVLATDTGYDEDQTIHPNELTLWRVIEVHQDESVDAVSEYVSTDRVLFTGSRGYANLVGGLQTISTAYAKSGYTRTTRMMGFNGQTLTISDTTQFDGTLSSPSNTTSTPEGELEYDGGVGGDSLYLEDIRLVSNVYGNDPSTYGETGLTAYFTNGENYIESNGFSDYYLASRYYGYMSSDESLFSGRKISVNGYPDYDYLIDYYAGNWWPNDLGTHLRPIITLNTGITVASGTGAKDDPFILN